MDTIFQGLQESSRFITNELKRFIEVDNHEAVEIGDLEKNSAIKVARTMFNKAIFPQPIREGSGLTLREGE